MLKRAKMRGLPSVLALFRNSHILLKNINFIYNLFFAAITPVIVLAWFL